MDRYFDPIYYSLSVAILLALGYAAFAGLRARPHAGAAALATVLGAIGTAVALLGGLFADLFLKNSPNFQQVRFGAYYLGFILITFCLEAAVRAPQASGIIPKERLLPRLGRTFLWPPFILTLAVASFYLFSPITFSYNASGSQMQLVVYWLPMLTATLVGALLLFLLSAGIKDAGPRAHPLWTGAFSALVFFGLLRESFILPDLGNPLANLLVAFVPFLLASLCLCFGARSLRVNPRPILP